MNRRVQKNFGVIYKITELGEHGITWSSSTNYEACQEYWDNLMKSGKVKEALMFTVTDTFTDNTILLKIYM